MADKEPRRRRKKKDAFKKEEPLLAELHAGEAHSVPQRSHSKDSDQDGDEDIAAASHLSYEPSKLAQIIFIILFVLLSVLMGSVFLTLRGSPGKFLSDVDVFEPINIEVIDHPESVDNVNEVVSERPLESLEEDESFSDIEENVLLPKSPELYPSVDESSSHFDSEPQADEDQEGPLDESLGTSSSPSTPVDYVEMVEEATFTSDMQIEEYPTETFTSSDMLQPNTDDVDISDEQGHEIHEESFITETPNAEDQILDTQSVEEEESSLKSSDYESLDASDINLVISSDKTADGITEEHVLETPIEETTSNFIPTTIPQEETLELPQELNKLEEDIISTDTSDADDVTTEENTFKEEHYFLTEELNDIDAMMEKNPESALQRYENVLKRYPSSPRALYGKAEALDLLADQKRSNELLEQAVTAYQKVLAAENVPDELYLSAGTRCAERMQFRGFVGKSIKTLIHMEERFPENTTIKNKIGVGYLLIGQNQKAKEVFTEVLKKETNNGFAKVHLGFILKTMESKFDEAIDLLKAGIASREEGVIDGRFFFHLGDALARVGRNSEALEIYKQGVEESLFLSVYQRSLYNVVGLTAKPWWNPKSTRYSEYFQILEKNWVAIKSEAVALLGSSKFIPESEGLKNYGEWEQLELFVRGLKMRKNCEMAPFTCSLIEQMPDASTCKRGQVKFSVMKPGTHVWAHTGPTNCRLRAHLGLVIPDKVYIRVARDTRTWQEGKVILFDDSFEHEVWHNGTTPRLVLIVDFWHPELTVLQRASLTPI